MLCVCVCLGERDEGKRKKEKGVWRVEKGKGFMIGILEHLVINSIFLILSPSDEAWLKRLKNLIGSQLPE